MVLRRIILSCRWHIRFVLLSGDYCIVGCGGLKLSWVVVVRHFVGSFNSEGTPDPL